MFIVATTTEPGHRLAAIMAGMAAVVAHHVAGLRAISSALVPMLSLLTWRLGRVAQRLDRLMLRWQAGTLPQPRPVRAPRRRPAAEASPPIYVPPIYVPQGHAWLIHLVQPTAQYMPQLERFLADPQTRALVAAAPQAGRLLRPLCRMLAIVPPDWLRLPACPPGPPAPASTCSASTCSASTCTGPTCSGPTGPRTRHPRPSAAALHPRRRPRLETPRRVTAANPIHALIVPPRYHSA